MNGPSPGPEFWKGLEQAAESVPAKAAIRKAKAKAAEIDEAAAEAAKPKPPEVDLAWPLQVLGRTFGTLAARTTLFRQGDGFVTVDAHDGEIRTMEPSRFCSWVEKVAFAYKVREVTERDAEGNSSKGWKHAFCRLGAPLAALILASDEFRARVRLLRGVQIVRLPVWRENGSKRSIELLPIGFDEQTGIYTVDTLPFAEDWDPSEAFKWFKEEVLAHYPWAQPWSQGVQFAAMLSPFVRLLLPAGAKRMMFVYTANQAGTGKSTLARMALFPVYGDAAAKSVDRNPDELRKVLDTCAMERKSFLFLDDVSDLRSRELNSFVTTGLWSARVLGKSQTVEVAIEAQVFITGNRLDVGRDLARRAAVCELFLKQDSLERKFEHEITDEWLLQPDTRQRFLAGLWAAVRHWRDSGMPNDPSAHRPSFEAYTALVGSIVSTFQMGAPFEQITLAGDEEGEATKKLLRVAAGKVKTGETVNYTPAELLTLAEELHLTDVILTKSYASDNGERRALGRKLAMWRGRELVGTYADAGGVDGALDSRSFEFGSREGRDGALYPITVEEPPAPPSDQQPG